MNSKFEEIKKQITEQWKNFESHFMESNTFHLLREKYQSLSVRSQKLITYTFLLFVLGSLLYLPISYFISSSAYWKEFTEKQNISLKMLKLRGKIASSVFRYSQVQLKRKITRMAEKYSDKKLEIKDKKSIFKGSKSVYQLDFEIHMKHLNVKQMVRFGTELHNLHQVRLEALIMEENQNYPKHYDIIYKVKAFISEDVKKPLGVKKNPRLKKDRKVKKRTIRNGKVKKDIEGTQ